MTIPIAIGRIRMKLNYVVWCEFHSHAHFITMNYQFKSVNKNNKILIAGSWIFKLNFEL